MKSALMLPNKGHLYGDANLLIELAGIAEESGWEGFFLWDHIGGGGDAPTMDPWLCLGAIAAETKTMRLGTMITPLARRRPQKVTREIVTLDHISHGRAVLGVGLGDMDPDAVPLSTLQSYGIPDIGVDIAFLPEYMLTTGVYHKHVTDGIHADHLILMHFTIPPSLKILDAFPNAVIFQKGMEDWTLR